MTTRVSEDPVRSMAVVPDLVACHQCDLLHEKTVLQPGERARCIRCEAFLYAHKENSIDRSLAFTVAALVTFVIANAFPFLSISVSGNQQSISVISAVFALSREGMWALAVLCLAFILVIPLLRMCGLLYILFPLRFDRHWRGSERVFRFIVSMSPWSMMEIYFLGTIVALVKLATMASIELGLSFWAFAMLNLLSVAATRMIDNHTLWDYLHSARGDRT